MKKILALILTLVLAFSFIGCSADDSETKGDAGNESSEVSEKSIEGTTIKVIAAIGGKEEIFSKFTEKTGVKVEFLDMSSGEALARLEAEGGNSAADIWFGGGIDSFIEAKEKGLLEQYVSDEMETLDKQYKDEDGYWSGFSVVSGGFLVNTDILEEKGAAIPTKWSDLTKDEYKDEIMMADPSISGTNYAVINNILQVQGEEEGWKYLEGLAKNVPFFAQRGGEPPKKVAAGEAAIGIIPMSGEYIALEKTAPVKAIYPEDGIPWVPAGLAIFKNPENLEGAKAFVDWVLSIEGQNVIKEADPRPMVRPEVENPDGIGDFDASRLMEIDIMLFGIQREDILNKWAEIVEN